MAVIGQSNFLQALGWAVLNSLWQMAMLWVIFQILIGVLNFQKSSQKSSLASAMLMGGFAWFIFTFISIWTNTSDGIIVSSAIKGFAANENLNTWLHKTLPVASVIYLLLLILPVLHFARNYRYVQVIRSFGLKKIDAQWRIFVKKVSAQMGIKKPVHIWFSDFITSPVTVGFLKPIILVPLAAVNHLTPQQFEAVLLHELSHIRRYDYLINLAINFIQTILYFNPFVKAFVKTVEKEREKSCDEMVMQFQYDPHGYASALLLLEKANHLSRPLTVSASGRKNDLLNRVELILGIYKKPVISFNRLAGLFAGLLCFISLNALLLFAKPGNNKQQMSSVSFTDLSSPFFFFDGNTTDNSQMTSAKKQIQKKKENPEIVVAKTESLNKEKQSSFSINSSDNIKKEVAPLYVNVNYRPAIVVPQLKSYQEAQINDALAKSKKILEEGQWKSVEKKIADVLTTNEKDQVKTAFQKEFNKLDLQKWGNQLRLAYNQVDWERINAQLGKAVYEIKLDSLQKVYNDAIINLETTEQQLAETNEKGVPDTDITIQLVEQKKLQVKKILDHIRAIRSSKIIHL